MSDAIRGLTRAVARQARRLAPPVPSRRAGCEATYGAVLDGQALWCAVDVSGFDDASDLVLRDRSGQVFPMGAAHVREGRHARLEALVDLGTVPTDPGGAVFDVCVVDRVGGDRAVLTGPDTNAGGESLASPDLAWRRRAYRTRKGTLAVEVRPLEACANVTSLVLAPGLVRIAGTVVPGGALEGSTVKVQIRRRTGTETVETEATAKGDDFEIDLPVADLGRAVTGDLETWDVFVVTGTEDVRVGRRLSDLRNLRQAVRYLSTAHSLEDGRRLAVRPYYTNDRYLALEVRSVDRSDSTEEEVLDR